MWQRLALVIITLGILLGAFTPVWVPWVLTGLFTCGILLFYTVKAITRSLFGRLDGEGETPSRELSFHGVVLLTIFFASMWLSWILR